MILHELTPPEGFELVQAVITTFDLDLAILKSFPGFNDDTGKFTVFRGEGEFCDLPVSDSDRESVLASVVTVPFPKDAEGLPLGSAHGKITLFDYVNVCDHEHLYLLLVSSANISSYDNLETYTVLSGKMTDAMQDKTLPLIEYLDILNSYADGRLDAIIERLRKVRFEPLPEYACEEHSLVAISPGKNPALDFLSEPFDELLVISPFINYQKCLSLIRSANENARVVILSQTDVIRDLVKDGLITESANLAIRLQLIPQSKTQKYIHAKVYLRRRDNRWDLFSGSMNLAPFSMTRNLEFMVHRVNPQGICSIEDYLVSFFSGSMSETSIHQRLSLDESSFAKTDSDFCRRAASPELRQAHLSELLKRDIYSEKQCDFITEYLLSPQCACDLSNMLSGNEAPALPVRLRSVQNGKSRETYVFPLKDRMLQGLINRALHDLDGCFSKKLFSHIQGFFLEHILTEIKQTPDFASLYILKTDIHAYDASMDADILSDALSDMPSLDRTCMDFLKTFIYRKSCLENGVLQNDAPAVQTGSPLCGFFENVYLRDTDYMLAEKAAFYARYVDDILIAARTAEELDDLIHTLRNELSKKKLQLNESKTLRLDPGSSFTYLGWKICGNQVDFTSEALSEFNTMIRHETKKLLIGCRNSKLPREMRLYVAISRANRLIDQWGLEEAFQVVSVHDSLKQIDRMFYDMIRTATSGKTGNDRFRIRHELIHKWGYRSLVNRYYRYIKKKKSHPEQEK